MKEININQNDSNQRFDKFLFKYFNTAPKSFIYKMLRKKRIKLNGSKAEGGEILRDGDTITMYLSDETISSFMEEKSVPKAERHFGIVYEDDNVIISEKPAGLLTHPQNNTDRDTLIDQILYYLYQKGQYNPSKESTFTPALCNRLDRNTGGIVLAGKNLMALQELNNAIASRKIQKFYITMVCGRLEEEKEFFGYHLKDDKTNQVKVLKKYVPGSSKIFTKVRPLVSNDKYTLLEVELITGKSHQIRAHLRAMGHPVVGDRKYGDEKVNKTMRDKFGLNNQFLYAYKVVFNQNEGGLSYLYKKEFISKLPAQFERVKNGSF